jgi:hypothetical protein
MTDTVLYVVSDTVVYVVTAMFLIALTGILVALTRIYRQLRADQKRYEVGAKRSTWR